MDTTEHVPESAADMPPVLPEESTEDGAMTTDAWQNANGEMIPLMQHHTVPVGRRVMANGQLYLAEGPYVWELRDVDGQVAPLTNAQMPGPSFTPNQVGDWVLTLGLGNGQQATLVFTVVEDV